MSKQYAKQYCVYIVSNKLRSLPLTRYKAYKIRNYFKSLINTEIKVMQYMDVVFEKPYNTCDLIKLGLV